MDNYDDIINLPHPVSKHHLQMPLRERAAQFAPFAALSGHKDAIRATEVHRQEMQEEEENFHE